MLAKLSLHFSSMIDNCDKRPKSNMLDTTPTAARSNAATSGAAPESSTSSTILSITAISITLGNRQLIKIDPESIRIFLTSMISTQLKSGKGKKLSLGSTSTEAAHIVDMNLCIEVDFLEHSIAIGFISGAKGYEKFTEKQVRNFLKMW